MKKLTAQRLLTANSRHSDAFNVAQKENRPK